MKRKLLQHVEFAWNMAYNFGWAVALGVVCAAAFLTFSVLALLYGIYWFATGCSNDE